MKWLPSDWDVMTIALALFAAFGTLVAGAVSVQGLTARARTMRVLEWVDKALSTEKNTHRVEQLVRMRTSAVARLVSGRLVPWWRHLELFAWLAFLPFAIYSTLAGSGTPAREFPWVFAVFAALATAARRSIRIYCESVRIRLQFEAGTARLAEPKTDLLNLMEGGTRVEFWYALILAAFVVGMIAALSAGVASMLTEWVSWLMSVACLVGVVWTSALVTQYARKSA